MLELAILIMLAFIMESVDNGLGGGFGTILSPLLILFGYDPKVVVPAILVSETISGVWGGSWHIKFRNVNFRAVGATLLGSLIGMTIATVLIGEVLPSSTVKQFIAILTILMGSFVVIRSFSIVNKHAKPKDKPSTIKTALLGLAMGFNKGGSGGNYGPLSVSGYILLGLPAAVAVGTTTVAEGIACALGVALYLQITGIVLAVAIPLAIGSFIADPISAWANNKLKLKLKPPFHGRFIGLGMTALGIVTLLKALGII
jgi:uncharacterized membrane protein YfcA